MLNIERYKDKIAEKMKNSDLGSSLARVFYEYCEDYGPTMAESDILDWLLSDAPILTEKERKYLKGVIAPFREKISFIKKKGYDSLMESGYKKRMEYLYISLGTEGMVMLAPNEKGTTYKGMNLGRPYTIKELGL